MNSKLRTELLKLIGHDDGVEFGNGYHDDCKAEVDEAEKAIRQAVGEEMLVLVGEGEVHVSHVCPQDSIPCAKFAARGALRHELRQKIKEWSEETTK